MKELIFSDLRKGDKFIDKDGDPWVKLEFFNCAKAALENESAEGSFYFSDNALVRKIQFLINRPFGGKPYGVTP